MDADSPVPRDRLRELLADVDAMAAEHREADRETVVVPPSDVSVLEGTPFGLEVVTPREAYEAFEPVVEAATLDTCHVYRTDGEEGRLLVLLHEGTLPPREDADGPAEISVFVPAYLPLPADALEARASAEGVMYAHVRPPGDDARVTFTHEDPSLFF